MAAVVHSSAPAGGSASAASSPAAIPVRSNIYLANSFDINVINWVHVASMYGSWICTGLVIVGVAILIPSEVRSRPTAVVDVASAVGTHVTSQWLAYTLFVVVLGWLISKKPSVYLVDFSVFDPPANWRVTHGEIVETLRRTGNFSEEALSFMGRMLERSGTGQATHLAPQTLKILRPELAPVDPVTGALQPVTGPDASIAAAREMADTVMFACMEDLLRRTGIRPRDIDFLIVNCSLFVPTPSLCASVCRRFGLRPDVRSYNLGGMGCSASLISIDLAKQLLQNARGANAVVISLEDITQQLYKGANRSMLLQNTLFRVGGAAILLSNRAIDGLRAKYKLLHTVRVQNTSEEAWKCVWQKEDEAGCRGIELSKDITKIAGEGLRANLTMLGPHVLPLSEQMKVVVSIIARRAARAADAAADALGVKHLPGTTSGRFGKVPLYVPDFKKGLQHFCIHAGGRAVIDGIEQNLKLEPYHTAPSRATLRTMGNTSSSSIWYELKYVEGEDERWQVSPEDCGGHPPHRIKAGARVCQLAFGSGFKVNSAVWLRLK